MKGREIRNLLKIFMILLSHQGLLMAQAPAFPGAEGHGKYTRGGRGGKVYEVTHLGDSGEGSLRAAVEASGARTVVFRVSGTIQLESRLSISNDSITIAGQTAPGDGITIRDYPVTVDANQVIIRFVRFRMGDVAEQEADALGGRYRKHIIVDHCSMSWSTDECVSFYMNEDFTLQWCLVGESLRNSVHDKGAHGYGGIWGGRRASFHHNLLAHHSSRNPRLGEARGDIFALSDLVDMRNNVLYNWGGQTCYGGEAMNVNIVNCYYKPGPASSNVSRIYAPDKLTDHGFPITDTWGKFYIDGNVLTASSNATQDNWTYGVYNQINSDYGLISDEEKEAMRMHEAHDPGEIRTHSAEEAYLHVLEHVGASLVRDTIDLRILHDMRTGTATVMDGGNGSVNGIIDTQEAVGGWPELESAPAPADRDADGMPDDWEVEKDLDPDNPEDRNDDRTGDGYTNLEEYMNSLVDIPWEVEPYLLIDQPLPGDGFLLEDTVKISAHAGVYGSNQIAVFQLFLDDQLIHESDSGYLDTMLTGLDAGAYELQFIAEDDLGNFVSDSLRIYVGTQRYDLSLSTGSGLGEINVMPEGSSFVEGTELMLYPKPAFTYRFQEWDGDVQNNENPLMLKMDSTIELQAHFIRDTGTYARINFQKPDSDTVTGYIADTGERYGEREKGLVFGFVGSDNQTALERSGVDDPRKATFNQMQKNGAATWELALPEGRYGLLLHMGDGRLTSQDNSLLVEGIEVKDTIEGNYFDEFYLPDVEVADGALTLVPTGSNVKINFLKIGEENRLFQRYIAVLDGKGSGDYTVGSRVEIEANRAGSSMAFLEWTGDSLYLENPWEEVTSMLMPDMDLIIRATYWTRTYALIVNQGVGSGTYEPGEQVFIVADTPAEGYEFLAWEVISGDAESIADVDADFTWVIMPEQDMEITARYTSSTGSKGIASAGTTRVFPNPAALKVYLYREKSGPAMVRIYSLQGALIYNEQVEGSVSSIQTSGLPRGACIMKIYEEDASCSVQKLILK